MEEHCDDDLHDDEIPINSHSFAEIVKTRMCPGPRKDRYKISAEDGDDSDPEDAAPQSTKDAFNVAQIMWKILQTPTHIVEPNVPHTDAAELEKAFAAATASQKKEYAANYNMSTSTESALRPAKNYSANDIWAWLDTKIKLGKKSK